MWGMQTQHSTTQSAAIPRLRELRLSRGVSQTALAVATGIRQERLCHFELHPPGPKGIAYGTLRRIAVYFEVSVEYLMGDDCQKITV